MTIAERKTEIAINKLKELSLEDLIQTWEVLDTKKIDAGVRTTRGWVMDELEARNKQAFDRWIDSDNASVREFYITGA